MEEHAKREWWPQNEKRASERPLTMLMCFCCVVARSYMRHSARHQQRRRAERKMRPLRLGRGTERKTETLLEYFSRTFCKIILMRHKYHTTHAQKHVVYVVHYDYLITLIQIRAVPTHIAKIQSRADMLCVYVCLKSVLCVFIRSGGDGGGNTNIRPLVYTIMRVVWREYWTTFPGPGRI